MSDHPIASRTLVVRTLTALLVAALAPGLAACGVDDDDAPPDDFCICPELFAPVCGVDGVTYSNECFATCEGVEIERDGRCEDPPGT